MKIVCDEGVPRALFRQLRVLGCDLSLFPPERRGLSNGRLIAAAEAAGFDALLSNDKNLSFQLNLATLKIAIVALPTNRRQSVVPRSADIADTLARVRLGQHIVMELDGRRILRRTDEMGAIVVEAIDPVAPFDV